MDRKDVAVVRKIVRDMLDERLAEPQRIRELEEWLGDFLAVGLPVREPVTSIVWWPGMPSYYWWCAGCQALVGWGQTHVCPGVLWAP